MNIISYVYKYIVQELLDMSLDSNSFITIKIGILLGAKLENINGKLIEAAKNNNIEKLAALLNLNANINFKDNYGETALMIAAEKSYNEITDLLLKKKANLEVKDNNGNTILMHVISNGNYYLFEQFLEKRADINTKNNDGNTPLILAIIIGNISMIKTLLKKKANVNTENNEGKTPLMFASCRGNIVIIKLLLDKGANIHAIHKNGNTSLSLAVSDGNIEAAKLLLFNGAKLTNEILQTIEPEIASELKKYALEYRTYQAHNSLIEIFPSMVRLAEWSENGKFLGIDNIKEIAKHLIDDEFIHPQTYYNLAKNVRKYTGERTKSNSYADKIGLSIYPFVPEFIYKKCFNNTLKSIIKEKPKINFKEILNSPEQQAYNESKLGL